MCWGKNIYIMSIPFGEAALQRYYHKYTSRKIPPNPQENNHTEVRPQQSRCVINKLNELNKWINKCFSNFKPLCCFNSVQQKLCFMWHVKLKSAIKLIKPHFGPILAPFSFFNFSPLCCCNFIQKFKKKASIIYRTLKPQCKTFSKKMYSI